MSPVATKPAPVVPAAGAVDEARFSRAVLDPLSDEPSAKELRADVAATYGFGEGDYLTPEEVAGQATLGVATLGADPEGLTYEVVAAGAWVF